MLKILEINDTTTIGFSLDGTLDAADVKRLLEEIDTAANQNGQSKKLHFYVEVNNFSLSDMTKEALKEDLKFWLKHPGLIPQIEKAALVTDDQCLKTAFDWECALIPTLTGKHFSFAEKDAAWQWLRTDQRAESRMDLTVSELAETAALKAAGGFAIGLLAANLFSDKVRKNVGKAVLAGSIAAGIPLALKVLNNNRNLLNA
jgi:hypothetical protein